MGKDAASEAGKWYAETWDGGYVRVDAKGRKVYVIRRMLNGKTYKVSTCAHTLRAALEQLKRFEAAPEGYSPAGAPQEQPLYLDTALASEFLTHSRDVDKNSVRWVKKQQGYLAWWADQLKGRNLCKRPLLDDTLPALEGQQARGHRIAVIKRVYSDLRKVKHVLTVAEDPTFGRLSVPQAEPEQWKRVKAISREHYLLAREHLTGHWCDALDILAGTGWHVSEIQRFAEDGRVEPYPRQGDVEGVASVLVCSSHKNGEELRTGASSEVVDAARRLRERGSLSIEKFGLAVRAACRVASIPEFSPGRFRHSVATWAINQGADHATVAAFLNHKSPRTTMRFYATHAIPKKIPTLR